MQNIVARDSLRDMAPKRKLLADGAEGASSRDRSRTPRGSEGSDSSVLGGARGRSGTRRSRGTATSSSATEPSREHAGKLADVDAVARPDILICAIEVCAAEYKPGDAWGQWQCRINSADNSVTYIAIGDRCGPCNHVWLSKETEYPSWEVCCEQTNKSKEKSNEWILCRERTLPGAIKPWVGADVGAGREQGTYIKVKSRGLTPEQFAELHEGRQPSELGYSLKLLPDEKGGWFRGIHMHDDGTLGKKGVRYHRYLNVFSCNSTA